MYYNRFGRCNRGQQCPYIHDPEKVAVCTRYSLGRVRSLAPDCVSMCLRGSGCLAHRHTQPLPTIVQVPPGHVQEDRWNLPLLAPGGQGEGECGSSAVPWARTHRGARGPTAQLSLPCSSGRASSQPQCGEGQELLRPQLFPLRNSGDSAFFPPNRAPKLCCERSGNSRRLSGSLAARGCAPHPLTLN